MKIRSLMFAASLAVSGVATAQSLPSPAEFYFDADASATKPVVAVRETGQVAIDKLAKLIERKPHAIEERAQLAHLAMEAGRVELGRQLYQAVLSRIDGSNGLYRAVLWNYGWDLYRAGDDATALEQWTTLMRARKVTAGWMPQTLALALWSLDRKDEAVQWYAAAVRTEPEQWRTAARHAALLPDWQPAERDTLAEVQAAWAANPPSWP